MWRTRFCPLALPEISLKVTIVQVRAHEPAAGSPYDLDRFCDEHI